MAIENPFKNMSKPAIYASLAGFVGITGYLMYRHHASTGSWNPWSSGSSASTPSPTTSTTQIDPVTGLPYSQDDATDPETGLTYLAEAEEYGSVATAEADVSQFGTTVDSGTGTTGYVDGTSTSSTGAVSVSTYTSNAAWSQAVQAGLSDVGYDPTTVASAIGAYLTGMPLTAAQVAIVNAAIAEYGPPPVGNLQVIQAPASGPATTATVPNVIGMSVADAVAAIQAAGLTPGSHSNEAGTVNGQTPAAGKAVAINSKVDLSIGVVKTTSSPTTKPTADVTAAPATVSVTPGTNGADIGWAPVKNAVAYQVRIEGPTNTTKNVGNVTSTHADLKPGNYHVNVRGGSAPGQFHGPWSKSHDFTVKS